MLTKLVKRVIKYLCKLSIFKITIIDRDNFKTYNRLETFCEYEFNSNLGPVKFIFKENRRKQKNEFFLRTFLVELKVPDNIKVNREDLKDKVLVVTKFLFCKFSYKILSEVLLDIYVDEMHKLAKTN